MRTAWAWFFLAVLAAGCGGASAPATAPTSTSIPGVSAVAENYLNEVVNLMQSNSINRSRIDWTDFRAQVNQRAQGAQTIADTYPAISVALGLLGDHHSFFVTP